MPRHVPVPTLLSTSPPCESLAVNSDGRTDRVPLLWKVQGVKQVDVLTKRIALELPILTQCKSLKRPLAQTKTSGRLEVMWKISEPASCMHAKTRISVLPCIFDSRTAIIHGKLWPGNSKAYLKRGSSWRYAKNSSLLVVVNHDRYEDYVAPNFRIYISCNAFHPPV